VLTSKFEFENFLARDSSINFGQNMALLLAFQEAHIVCILHQATVVHGCGRDRHLLQHQQPAQLRQRRGAMAAGSASFLSTSTRHTLRQQGRPPAAGDDVIIGGESWRRDVTTAESPAGVREQGARREGGRTDRSAEADRMLGKKSTRGPRCFPGGSVSCRQLPTTT